MFKKRILMAALCAAIMPLAAFAQASGDILPFNAAEKTLPNGLKVIVVPTGFPNIVSLQIPVQTGARNEIEPGKTGFAHFFKHMMFRGTPTHPADAYGAIMKAAGADQNAYTDDDYTNYYVNFTPEDLDQVLAVEADRFRNLAYSEEQFRTEALAVKGEYLKNYSNPLLKGFERLQDIAYTTHTYKHTAMGFLKDIEDMPNQMAYAKEFFARWYRPEYTTVIVAGDIDPEDALAKVEKHFGGWQRGSYTVEVPAEPLAQKAMYEHVAWEGPTLPWIIAGWRAPAFGTAKPDSAALMLLGELYFGDTSELYQKIVVRERLADTFFHAPARNRDPGLFIVAARLTKPENAAAVTSAIQATLNEAKSVKLGELQLAETKSRLKYGFAAGMNSAASIGAILASFMHYERDVETLNRFYATFDAVSADDVVAVANTVFADRNRSVVSIANGPALAGANDFREADDAARHAHTTAALTRAEAKAPPPLTDRQRREKRSYERNAARFSATEAAFSVPIVEQKADSPLVDVVVLLNAGAAYDPPGKKGLAALTAAMIAEGGSGKMTIDEVKRAYYPLASELGVQVDKEIVKFSGTVHRDNVAKWWAIAAEQLYDPGFREDDFQRLRQQQVNYVRTSLRGNNDEEFAKEALYETIYGPAHPYGTLSAGHARDLEAITLDDVRAFYKAHYLRPRITVGLAGGYDELTRDAVLGTQMRVEFDAAFRLPTIAPIAPAKARSAVVIRKETSSVAVSFGVPIALKRGDPDWLALWLVRSWLGEHRNSSAQLYNRIREVRGMNYGDYAYIEYFPGGMFRMQPDPNYARRNDLFQVWLRPLRDNNDAVFATRVALFELDKLVRDGIPAEGFEATRAFLRKFVRILTATQAKRLGYALDSRFHGIAEFADYVRDGLEALTLEQVNAAIRRHIVLDGLQFVYIAKDADGLAALLESGSPTPITYNTEKPAELVAEDEVIERYPLGLAKGRVKIVKDSDLFE